MHFNGSNWSNSPVPAAVRGNTKKLHAIWGTSANDVWAAGDGGAVLHWDGSAWTGRVLQAAAEFHAIWGAARDDVWMTGTCKTCQTPPYSFAYHWDGTDWTRFEGKIATASVWGTGSNDVWTAGGSSFVTHWDGSAWTQIDMDLPASLQVIRTRGQHVWLGGGLGALIHRTR